MEQNELLELVAEILEVESVALTDDLADKGWDSLSNLTFIAEVDERVGVEVDADGLAHAVTVADLLPLTRA
ncbi:acyl carrier protein [Microbacterium capsulatum]|uniref:Acyl carrier protein n=1 Tax=Microbacterium capsulatum TaxID=3041921 RepID=A0ABU0XGI6_9MICO|nr:acyl carrier protein [Microbacterium sp. ASV81]MDQ4214238.1 acyl carrier protein [Microbacterium sp. ASV81]